MFKRILSISLAILLTAAFFGCSSKGPVAGDPTANPTEGDIMTYLNEVGKVSALSVHTMNESLLSASEYNERYTEVNNSFAALMAKVLGRNKTCVYSPLSLQIALQILANGANDATSEALLNAVCPGITRDDVNASTARLIYTLLTAKGVNVNTAVVANCAYRVSEKFAAAAADYYRASVGALDFTDPIAALKEINSWVSEHTDGLVNELLDRLDRETVVVILNTLTLDLNWETPFKLQSVSTEFKGLSGTANVKMLGVTKELGYGSFDEGEMVLVPYEGGEFCMAVILPSEGTDPADAAAALLGRQGECKPTSVSLQMPQVKIDSKHDILAMAKELGIEEGVTGSYPNLISGTDFDITQIVQGASLSVSETGTKAAAATAIVGSKGISLMNGEVFVQCNRPYAMVIYQIETGVVLFVSTVGDVQ